MAQLSAVMVGKSGQSLPNHPELEEVNCLRKAKRNSNTEAKPKVV
jgi:hypothetical protein